jgi:hypothetical protein
MEMVVKFWDLLIQEDDQIMIFYFCVALLCFHRQVLALPNLSSPSLSAKAPICPLS